MENDDLDALEALGVEVKNLEADPDAAFLQALELEAQAEAEFEAEADNLEMTFWKKFEADEHKRAEGIVKENQTINPEKAPIVREIQAIHTVTLEKSIAVTLEQT